MGESSDSAETAQTGQGPTLIGVQGGKGAGSGVTGAPYREVNS